MKCPKCGREVGCLRTISMEYKTLICDECGINEALDAAGIIEGSSLRAALISGIKNGIMLQGGKIY